METQQPPKPDQYDLIVYLIGRLHESERRLDQIHEAVEEHNRRAREHHWFHVAAYGVKGVLTFSSQIAAVFVAGYVWVAHSGYVEGIEQGIGHVLRSLIPGSTP